MDQDTSRQLETVLDREIEAAHALAATLQAERVALTGNSPEDVMEKAQQKTELFGMIEQLETQRHHLCEAASITLPHRQRGRVPLIAGVSETVADRWHALLELIASCRVANEVNGYIINARRGQVNQLFNVLRGGAPITYGPQGRTFASSLRALARA